MHSKGSSFRGHRRSRPSVINPSGEAPLTFSSYACSQLTTLPIDSIRHAERLALWQDRDERSERVVADRKSSRRAELEPRRQQQLRSAETAALRHANADAVVTTRKLRAIVGADAAETLLPSRSLTGDPA